jgi:hypothetical protein
MSTQTISDPRTEVSDRSDRYWTPPPGLRFAPLYGRHPSKHRYFYCHEQYTDAKAIAEDLLTWAGRLVRATVLDPDTREWLRYDPAAGKYSPMSGTALQGARVIIMEAVQALEASPWFSAQDYPPGHEYWWEAAWVREHLLGTYAADYPAMTEIAQAMIDLSCAGSRADETRAAMDRGRSPEVMFHPQTWTDYGRWAEWDGYGNTWGRDDAVSLRAARYTPAGNVDGPLHTDAPTPGWDRLCELVWPDPDWREAALRGVSMGFTGRATKYVPYWRSETGQGKSLVAAFFSDLLGDYAKSVPAKTLFGYTADPQRAAQELVGTWLAVVEEGIGSESFRADEAFKASTTGGADMNTRKLYQESRQERASHTVLLCVNPEADMNYADPAIRSRLAPVPFTGDPLAIREHAQLYNPSSEAWKAEAPAVLAKMLGYARDYWDGLWVPETLEDMLRGGTVGRLAADMQMALDMRTDTNVADWVAATRRQLAVRQDGYRARDLYLDYTRWSALTGGEAVSETRFGRELVKVDGVTRTRRAAGNVYQISPLAITP